MCVWGGWWWAFVCAHAIIWLQFGVLGREDGYFFLGFDWFGCCLGFLFVFSEKNLKLVMEETKSSWKDLEEWKNMIKVYFKVFKIVLNNENYTNK